ncbi:hypothetical protein [Mesorhizobium sp. L48C026A00]|uniref:hypothetical protein n=1 Tax=Mesorhizobium sp. L48C026A00 TaxID=1287182 RepID=UPI0003D04426|nr:hypothetical protein [Mesorhizobium sp. L48C026A00]ESZ12156.1 hypothetical protein X737_27520 [Mesorhizobium sp. L48C026A00]
MPALEDNAENTRAELSRDFTRMRLLHEQIREIERERLYRRASASTVPAAEQGAHAMVRPSRGSSGLPSRRQTCCSMRFCRATYAIEERSPRYAGLTGRPTTKRRREKGLARAGNVRVRYGIILLAWRFLQYQKDSALAR